MLVTRFIQPIEEATWLSPIMVVLKKNGKLKYFEDFWKFNKATIKNPYPLPFFDEALNIIARYEAYSFLDGYSRYHLISIVVNDRYKTTFITQWGTLF